MRMLAMPKTAEPWSLTSLREKLIKIAAKVVSHGRYVTFQLAGVAADVQGHPDADRPAAGSTCAGMTRAPVQMRRTTRGEVCTDVNKRGAFAFRCGQPPL